LTKRIDVDQFDETVVRTGLQTNPQMLMGE
jgi:hypothetical protein